LIIKSKQLIKYIYLFISVKRKKERKKESKKERLIQVQPILFFLRNSLKTKIFTFLLSKVNAFGKINIQHMIPFLLETKNDLKNPFYILKRKKQDEAKAN